ncbi:uncharacterized protein [Clytia hemisphaerica]|uniref:uncharacterized protein n=1 Tax=Clytia hemisphaerica TaxID=252671 RepID=UPI0034D7635C
MLKTAADVATLEVELAFADKKGISEMDKTLLEEKFAKKKALLNVYENWQPRVPPDENALRNLTSGSIIESSESPKVESTRVESPRGNPEPLRAETPEFVPTENSQTVDASSGHKTTFLPVPPSGPRPRIARRFGLPVAASSPIDSVLSNAIFDLVKLQGAPSVELSVFTGDPLDYKFFMTNFEELVEKRISDSEGRLARLLKFTTGDANDLIQCCLYMTNGYERAKALLKKKYGDPHRIMIAYKKQLDNWENVKLGDSSSFGKFHSFLLKCGSVIEGNLWNSFDTADNLCIIASKLPNCRNRRTCVVCNKRHPTTLHGLRIERRPPADDSKKTDCDVRPSPPVPRPRPDIAKFDDSKSKPETKGTKGGVKCGVLNNSANKNLSMCVVPVLLRHDHSKSDIVTYALLDTCSQACFISDEIVSLMSLKTISTDLSINTITSVKSEKCQVASGLRVKGLHAGDGSWLSLPKCFSKPNITVDSSEIPTADSIKEWPYLKSIENELPNTTFLRVGILISANCLKAIEPLKVIPSQDDGPFAFKTKLGWCVVGPISSSRSSDTISCCRVMVNDHGRSNHLVVEETQVKDSGIESMLKNLFDIESVPETKLSTEYESFSQDDLHFLEIVENRSEFIDGHYHVPLPFRNENISFPDNRPLALKRLSLLKKRFESSSKFYSDYVAFMNNIIDKGWCQEVSSPYPDGQNWYIPHHGVYHPTKQKIRVVFDCSSSYKGVCMNKELMQGPDLTNHLIGVLIRFRQEFVAFTADIEAMFFQIYIPESQRRFHQFLWWRDGDFSKDPVCYEMNTHLQGSTSSPSCSNFALKQTASAGENEFGVQAANTLRKNFYVDDLLKSTESVESAKFLISDVSSMCDYGGFHLTKFTSNFPEALESVPPKEIKECKSTERVLGVLWSLEDDVFQFKAPSKVFSRSRRGMLSALNSIYDPLGLISPFILKGRLIFQTVCQLSIGWDDPVPNEYLIQWDKWVESLVNLQVFSVSLFTRIVEISLHHFSDACDYGYSGCHYLRFVTSDNYVHCSLVMGKSRVVPAKSNHTMPRLELIAATLSSQIAKFISKEFDYEIAYELFWCDNTCALGYISNTTKKFRKFVANRVCLITKTTKSSQWNYVESENNPADHGSRGLKIEGNEKKVSEWFNGPSFLWEHPLKYDKSQVINVSESDPEVVVDKTTSVMVIKPNYVDIISHLESRVSSFLKMKKIISFVLLYMEKLRKKNRIYFRKTRSQPEFKMSNLLSVDIMTKASVKIFKLLQSKYFFSSASNSKISSLNPFTDDNGLLRVGGRLGRSLLDPCVKYPIIIPRESDIAKAIVRFYHDKVHHAGRNVTMNEIRENGIWITSLCSLVKSVIWNCFLCRKLRGKFGSQIMSDLPFERTLEAPPFSFCGVDLFGPFLVKERRSLVKRWGVIYTCLSSRSAHIESVVSMNTDSFILCLRRFICRRGSIRMLRSDNGSNFVGAQSELKELFKSLDHDKIKAFLRDEFDADYVVWERNPPYSSHFGGVWERQIRSIRAVLDGILQTHSSSFNDESLRTLLCEAECIINSRPLSVENIGDPLSLKPITPMMLLTGKSRIVLPPPGAFGDAAAYSRRQWKRVQHVVNEFWSRWRKEYLTNLQERTRWLSKRRNFRIGDIVMVKMDAKRNQWPIGRVTKANVDERGHCRKVTIKLINGEVERPITNIILLEEYEK